MKNTRGLRIAGLLLAMLGGLMASEALAVSVAIKPAQIGRATGTMGKATVDGKPINVGTPVFEGSKIVTGGNEAASVLLASHVVIKVGANSSAVFTEAKGTHITLEQGDVEVFLAKRAATDGAVALSDPDATIEALGTVFVASYSPVTRDGYYATLESTRPEGPKVKGNADPAAIAIAVGQQAREHNGKLVSVDKIDVKALRGHTQMIEQLDKGMREQAGANLRQTQALTDASTLYRQSNITRFAAMAGHDVSGAEASNATAQAVNWKTVTDQVHSSALTTSGGGGSTGGGSTKGLSDVTVSVGATGALSFRLFDNGAQDGDNVSLRIVEGSKTIQNVPFIGLTNAGQVFSPAVQPGIVILYFRALNEGSFPPNTGGVNILSTVVTGPSSQSYLQRTGQTAVLRVRVTK